VNARLQRARWLASASLTLALACARQPAGEPVVEPNASEPVVFVEAPPERTQSNATQPSPTIHEPSAEEREAGDFAGAIEHFEHAYQLAPMPALRFNIARTRQQLGDTAGACAEYAELLADPNTEESIREHSSREAIGLGC
jgi:hypothetical protein